MRRPVARDRQPEPRFHRSHRSLRAVRAWMAEAEAVRAGRSRTPWRWPPSMPRASPMCAWSCSRAPTSGGFVFYTNCESAKGSELAANPQGGAPASIGRACTARCACAGRSSRRARPRPTPISPRARAKAASAPGPRSSRARLDSRARSRSRVARLAKILRRRHVPRPPYWRATGVMPLEIEFWHSRAAPAA